MLYSLRTGFLINGCEKSQYNSGGGRNLIFLILFLLFGRAFANAKCIKTAVFCKKDTPVSEGYLLRKKYFFYKVVKELALFGHIMTSKRLEFVALSLRSS